MYIYITRIYCVQNIKYSILKPAEYIFDTENVLCHTRSFTQGAIIRQLKPVFH